MGHQGNLHTVNPPRPSPVAPGFCDRNRSSFPIIDNGDGFILSGRAERHIRRGLANSIGLAFTEHGPAVQNRMTVGIQLIHVVGAQFQVGEGRLCRRGFIPKCHVIILDRRLYRVVFRTDLRIEKAKPYRLSGQLRGVNVSHLHRLGDGDGADRGVVDDIGCCPVISIHKIHLGIRVAYDQAIHRVQLPVAVRR